MADAGIPFFQLYQLENLITKLDEVVSAINNISITFPPSINVNVTGGSINVSNFPNNQNVVVSNFPTTQVVTVASGSVNVSNLSNPLPVSVVNFPASTNAVVTNFPAVQSVRQMAVLAGIPIPVYLSGTISGGEIIQNVNLPSGTTITGTPTVIATTPVNPIQVSVNGTVPISVGSTIPVALKTIQTLDYSMNSGGGIVGPNPGDRILNSAGAGGAGGTGLSFSILSPLQAGYTDTEDTTFMRITGRALHLLNPISSGKTNASLAVKSILLSKEEEDLDLTAFVCCDKHKIIE